MFPGPEQNNQQGGFLDPTQPQASYPPQDPIYPPTDASYQPTNPYNTPLAGAPNTQHGHQSPNQDPAPSAQQPNPYQSPYSQQPNPYPDPNLNQPWPPQPNYMNQPYGGGMYTVPVDADRIMTYGIVSIFCFGFILGPYSIYLANQAIRAINAGQADPILKGKCQTGLICGTIASVLWFGKFLLIAIALATSH